MIVGQGNYKYEMQADWLKMPNQWKGSMAAVTVDSKDHIYAFNRGDHPVQVFNKHGDFLHSWGEGLFASPHGIYADKQDNIWIVDRNNGQIFKFTTDGELLLTIGVKGFRSNSGVDNSLFTHTLFKDVTRPGGPFNLPANIAVSDNGNLYIADGDANCQMHIFSPEGKHISSWGEPGNGPGQFVLPHAVWIDRKGRVLVADRENNRIQVFDQSGNFLHQWPSNLIGPACIWIDNNDVVFIPEHNGGFFSVLSLDGELLSRWGSEKYKNCHGVSGDSDGNIYFVQPINGEGSSGRTIVKYIKT